LETTKSLAHSTTLDRPIPGDYAIFPVEQMLRDEGRLTCPARPKFRFGQTKKEVEKNEEGLFKKWLKSTEEVVTEWVEGGEVVEDEEETGAQADEQVQKKQEWPRSPSWFETNLEVWRQLSADMSIR
jgi:hypothetical protein